MTFSTNSDSGCNKIFHVIIFRQYPAVSFVFFHHSWTLFLLLYHSILICAAEVQNLNDTVKLLFSIITTYSSYFIEMVVVQGTVRSQYLSYKSNFILMA